jgi:hypothetical protein
MALDGIGYLIAVTQLKSDNANNSQMDGASKQHGSVGHPKGPLYPPVALGTVQNAVQGTLAQIKSSLDAKGNDLQGADKLGNFEIQSLMSDYNEAATTKSSVLKKVHDTTSTVIGKI